MNDKCKECIWENDCMMSKTMERICFNNNQDGFIQKIRSKRRKKNE